MSDADIDRVARLLMDAWERAENSPPNVATFTDMARAVIGSDSRPDYITGPTIELAAKVKAVLESSDLEVRTGYGLFYVGRVELGYSDSGAEYEVLGHLVPDEASGKTYDFWVPKGYDG